MATRKAPAKGTTTPEVESDAAGVEAHRTPEERAQRDRIVAHALHVQSGIRPPLTPEEAAQVEAFERTMLVLDRQPSADQRAAEQEAARRQEVYRRNVDNGYDEWRPLLDGGDCP